MHLNRSARNPNFSSLVYKTNDDYSFVQFPVSHVLENRLIRIPKDPYYRLTDKDCPEVVGSCNGLICLRGDSTDETTNDIKVWFRLWNPATRTISDRLGSDDTYDWKYSKFVFCYDDSTGIYKVVALTAEYTQWITNVRVLSLSDNVWRIIPSFPVVPFPVGPRVDDGVYFSSTINWRAYDIALKFVIISLDLVTETYTQMLPPPGFEDVVHATSGVCVLMNSFCFYHDFNETDLVIWQMTEFGDEKSWTQFLKFSYNNIPMIYGSGRYYLRLTPVYLSENGDTLAFTNSLQDRAIIYNRRTNKARITRINTKISWSSIKDYVESLVSTS